MTQRRLYLTATAAGILLAACLGLWKRSAGAAPSRVLLWAAGGLAVALLIAVLADIGMRLQRRDIPLPRSADEPATRSEGKLDDE